MWPVILWQAIPEADPSAYNDFAGAAGRRKVQLVMAGVRHQALGGTGRFHLESLAKPWFNDTIIR